MLGLGFRRVYKQFTYVETSKSIIVTPEFLALVKEQLRLPPDDTSEDNYLGLLITVAYNYAEKYTRRTLLTTGFSTFRDSFASCCFELRRSPFISLTSITYQDRDNVTQVLPAVDYYVTQEAFYARLLRAQSKSWPTHILCQQQAIEIKFIAGYGDVYTDIPSDLLMALLNHIAKLYESRGDCDDSACANALPSTSRMIYDMYKISDIMAAKDCGEEYRGAV